MPNPLTTSNHENPLFCLSFVALELSPNRAGLHFAYICFYLRTTFCAFSFYVKNSANSPFSFFSIASLWAFSFLFWRGVQALPSTRLSNCRCGRVHFVSLFSLPFVCVSWWQVEEKEEKKVDCGGKRDEHASPSFVLIFVLNSIRLARLAFSRPLPLWLTSKSSLHHWAIVTTVAWGSKVMYETFLLEIYAVYCLSMSVALVLVVVSCTIGWRIRTMFGTSVAHATRCIEHKGHARTSCCVRCVFRRQPISSCRVWVQRNWSLSSNLCRLLT
jgi:hypothetical protein